MKDQIYLAVDLGAESGRVIAGSWNGSQMRLEEVHRFANEPVEIGNGLHWDIARLWLEIQNGLGVAVRRYGDKIVSVGVDTWGVDFVLLSKNSEILGQPHTYRDKRTKGIMDATFRKMSREEIFAESGLQFMEFNTLYQMISLRQQAPELLDTADCFLMIPDFLNWCLSGEKANEFSNATTTQFFHPTKRTWSHALLQKFDLPQNIFREAVAPGSRIGALQPSVMRKTGLKNLSVIAPATHDTGSAVAAVPTTNTGKSNWAYISSGTWSLMGTETPTAQLSRRVLELNFTNEGGVDGKYRLLKNIMGLWLVQQCKRSFEKRGHKWDYPELVRMAAAEPALLSFVDATDSRFLNPDDMPTAIQQFCRETGQPVPENEGALIRCALESLALAYERTLHSLEELNGTAIEAIHVVGGGSRNDLLNQFTADACGRPVIAGPVEATALGNLLMQARGSGEIGSLQELRKVVANSSETRRFDPKRETAQAWHDAKCRLDVMLKR